MTRRMIPILVFGLAGTAVLVALCLWQLRRLEWKEAILDRIETRLALAPGALPDSPDEAEDIYRPVRLTGRIVAGRELHVLTSAKPGGPGFRVIAPFETAAGRLILIDRGYVPEAEKALARATGPAAITGNLHWPDETDSFTPDPNLERNIWFARDVAAMARALDTEPVLVVVRDTSLPGARALPVSVDIPNDHLQYALTWAALACVWLVMTGVWLLRIHRRTA